MEGFIALGLMGAYLIFKGAKTAYLIYTGKKTCGARTETDKTIEELLTAAELKEMHNLASAALKNKLGPTGDAVLAVTGVIVDGLQSEDHKE